MKLRCLVKSIAHLMGHLLIIAEHWFVDVFQGKVEERKFSRS
jgi:hypothetical protein